MADYAFRLRSSSYGGQVGSNPPDLGFHQTGGPRCPDEPAAVPHVAALMRATLAGRPENARYDKAHFAVFAFEVTMIGVMYRLTAPANDEGTRLVSEATAFGLRSTTREWPL
jgi:hypothetical protein